MWPPPGIQLPPFGLATFALVPLVLSAFGSYLASEGAKKNDRGGMLLGLGLNLVARDGRSWSCGRFVGHVELQLEDRRIRLDRLVALCGCIRSTPSRT